MSIGQLLYQTMLRANLGLIVEAFHRRASEDQCQCGETYPCSLRRQAREMGLPV